MAEVGAIASIIGIAGAGAKLSIVLFDFAATVGGAGLEIRHIGTEISLFCSVSKQLQSTLTKAKAYRYSTSAIDTTQEILDKCQEIFKEIEDIINGLAPKGVRTVQPSTNFIAKVKWTFKRSRVQLLRMMLESFKYTLHIMLTTMDFAQKIAMRRVSTVATQKEDEQDEAMTQSLIMAHQLTVDTLETLEEAEAEEEGSSRSGPMATTARLLRFTTENKSNRLSRLMETQRSPNGSFENNIPGLRISVWVNELVLDRNLLPRGFERHTWGETRYSTFFAHHPDYLLDKWTDQGEHLRELKASLSKVVPPGSLEPHSGHQSPESLHDLSRSSLLNDETAENLPGLPLAADRRPSPHNSPCPSFSDDPIHEVWNEEAEQTPASSSIDLFSGSSTFQFPSAPTSPETQTERGLDVITKENPSSDSVVSQTLGLLSHSPQVEIFKSFRVTMEDPTRKVLPAALKKYNIMEPWDQYALYIVYGDKERCLGMHE